MNIFPWNYQLHVKNDNLFINVAIFMRYCSFIEQVVVIICSSLALNSFKLCESIDTKIIILVFIEYLDNICCGK